MKGAEHGKIKDMAHKIKKTEGAALTEKNITHLCKKDILRQETQ